MQRLPKPSAAIHPNWLRPTLHPAYPRLMCAQLHRRGIQMADLFLDNSLSWDELQKRSRFISFDQFRRLIHRAIHLTQCPWLALEISSILKVSAHGPLGYGALAAQTLGDSFALIHSALPIRQKIYAVGFERDEQSARFVLREHFATEDLHEFLCVALFGSFLDLIETATGTPVANIRVEFGFAEPAWVDRYQQHFPEVRLSFGASETCIEIPAQVLRMSCLTADEYVYRNALRECEQLLAQSEGGATLAAVIKAELFDAGAPYPDQERMAEWQGMSVRTLIRHLKKEDTSYQALLDEVRQELACWLLQNSEKRVEEIAELLGFVDTSNFSRVFRRWFGRTPSEFRVVGR